VSSVTDMFWMFDSAPQFEQCLHWLEEFASSPYCSEDSSPACSSDTAKKEAGGGSIAIIIPVVVAAVLLVAAVVYLARKRRVARLQPHRQSSVPTIGGEVEA
jgi:hypothetical protein